MLHICYIFVVLFEAKKNLRMWFLGFQRVFAWLTLMLNRQMKSSRGHEKPRTTDDPLSPLNYFWHHIQFENVSTNHLDTFDNMSLFVEMREKVGNNLIKWHEILCSKQRWILGEFTLLKSGFLEIFQEVTAIRFWISFINLMCWKGCLHVENAKQKGVDGNIKLTCQGELNSS